MLNRGSLLNNEMRIRTATEVKKGLSYLFKRANNNQRKTMLRAIGGAIPTMDRIFEELKNDEKFN